MEGGGWDNQMLNFVNQNCTCWGFAVLLFCCFDYDVGCFGFGFGFGFRFGRKKKRKEERREEKRKMKRGGENKKRKQKIRFFFSFT